MSLKDSIKRICIYGMGGVGGYFGGKVAHNLMKANDTLHEIYFIARGSHLREIKEKGLTLNTSEMEGMICKPTLATDSFETLPEFDLIFICVKSYDLDEVIMNINDKVKNDTVIIPLLNGVDVYDRIRSRLKKGIVLPACVYVGTHLERPGVVTQRGVEGVILTGKDPQYVEYVPEAVLQFLTYAGINYKWYDNPDTPIWEKFVFIAAFGLVTAAYGKTLGEVMADSGLKVIVNGIMNEICLIAEKAGVVLSETIVPDSLNKANNFPFEAKTSFQRDVEQKGKRHEGDLFGGTIVRMGKMYGVPTPVTEDVYRLIPE